MLSQCSDFMKTWLSAEDESSIDSFSSKTVHFLIPHVLCQLRRLVYVFLIPFFKCFLISLMKIPFYTVAMTRRRWGWEIAQSEDNTECREIFVFWKGLNQGLKGGRKWRTGEREITVSVRSLGIKLHVISGKNYPLKHEGPFLYCKVKEEVGDFRYNLTFIFLVENWGNSNLVAFI